MGARPNLRLYKPNFVRSMIFVIGGLLDFGPNEQSIERFLCKFRRSKLHYLDQGAFFFQMVGNEPVN